LGIWTAKGACGGVLRGRLAHSLEKVGGEKGASSYGPTVRCFFAKPAGGGFEEGEGFRVVVISVRKVGFGQTNGFSKRG